MGILPITFPIRFSILTLPLTDLAYLLFPRSLSSLSSSRPFSAPAIPPEGGLLPEGIEEEGLHKTPHILKTYTLEKPTPTTAPTTFRPTKPPGKKARIRVSTHEA